MASLREMEIFLNTLLDKDAIADYTPNGVQVRGREVVHKVVTGVSACLALFEAAVAAGADLLITHHGLIWDKEPHIVEGAFKRRLKLLLDHDLSLISYHLPLDRHPQVGNNAGLLNGLALQAGEPFGYYRGIALSRMGRWSTARTLPQVVEQVQRLLGGQPLVLPFGPAAIATVAVCSGGAPELAREALQKGADLFLVGEASEPLFHFAREEGLHVIAAGHHRTEKFGVMALGGLLAEKFGVIHQFVDIDNPV